MNTAFLPLNRVNIGQTHHSELQASELPTPRYLNEPVNHHSAPNKNGAVQFGMTWPGPAATLLGLGPLLSCVAQPFTTAWSNKQAGFPEREQRAYFAQETVRQMISGAITLASFFGGIFLDSLSKTLPALEKLRARFSSKNAIASKGLGPALWIIALNFVGYSLIRPRITPFLIKQLFPSERPDETTSQNISQTVSKNDSKGHFFNPQRHAETSTVLPIIRKAPEPARVFAFQGRSTPIPMLNPFQQQASPGNRLWQ